MRFEAGISMRFNENEVLKKIKEKYNETQNEKVKGLKPNKKNYQALQKQY